MPRFTAECYLSDKLGISQIEVSANTSYQAQDIMRKVYGAQRISNIREIRENNTNSSTTSGGAGILILLGFIWALFSFAPWILMIVGGMFGTWIGQFVTGSSLEESVDREDVPRVLIVFVLAILAGGFGFVKGNEVKDYFNTPDTQVEQRVQK